MRFYFWDNLDRWISNLFYFIITKKFIFVKLLVSKMLDCNKLYTIINMFLLYNGNRKKSNYVIFKNNIFWNLFFKIYLKTSHTTISISLKFKMFTFYYSIQKIIVVVAITYKYISFSIMGASIWWYTIFVAFVSDHLI